MEDKITIDKKKIASFVRNGSQMMFKKEAEEELLKLLKLKDQIEEAITTVKTNILEAGRSITPDFTGVVGNKLKCVIRRYGDRYKTTNPEYVKEIIIKRADGDKIDQHLQETGKLPDNTTENEREEKLTIIVPNEKSTTIGQISS